MTHNYANASLTQEYLTGLIEICENPQQKEEILKTLRDHPQSIVSLIAPTIFEVATALALKNGEMMVIASVEHAAQEIVDNLKEHCAAEIAALP